MSTTVKKRKRHAAYLNDSRKQKVVLMAKVGGFSHRAIARWVLGTPFEVDDESAVRERCSISHYLQREGIKLSDWRNGMSLSAQGHIQKLLKTKKRISKKLQTVKFAKS